jgi:putative addiction module component (TIGR02574 family)
MARTVDEIKAEVARLLDPIIPELLGLSPEDRAEVLLFLVYSLEPVDPEIEAAWDVELTRRAEHIKSGQATGEPVERVLAALRERYS